MATCACALCIRCLRRCRICPHSPPDQCSVPESAPPDCYTSVPLVRIFDVSNHLPLSMVHSDARKLSLITEQQTLFYSATLLSPKAPVPTPSAAARRASSLFAFSSSPSLVSCKLEKHQSCVDFMIFYDIQSCAFTVKLLNVRSLPPMNSDGFVNSYVTLYLLPHKEQVFRSKTCQKDLDPMIYQIFVFDHIPFNEISTRTLVLRVYNAKTNRHTELIGNVVLPLRKAELHGVRVSAVLNQLEDIDNTTIYGDIQVALQYDKAINSISGVIIKAANLKKMDYFGLSDPYVKLQLYDNDGKKTRKKWYSKVQRNTLSPFYNERFHFDIDKEMKMEKISLRMILKDEDHFSKDDVLGVVNFGSLSDHMSGRSHWNDMIDNPDTRLTRWHSLNCDSTITFKFIHNWL